MKRVVVFLLLTLTLVAPALAQESKRVEINVETTLEPTRAVGLVLSPTGTKQKLNTKIEKSRVGAYIVSFDVREQEIVAGTMASAILEGDSGEHAYGNIRPLFQGITGKSGLTLPECITRTSANPALLGDLSSLLTLVDVRETRREVLLKKIRMVLKGDLLSSLARLELGFGIGDGTPLSAELPPVILLDRLTRIQAALAAYDSGKAPEVKP